MPLPANGVESAASSEATDDALPDLASNAGVTAAPMTDDEPQSLLIQPD
jgi:hypothetical protein